MADNYTGTDWKTKTKISTDIMSEIDEGLKKNTDLIDSIDILNTGTAINSGDDLNDYTTAGRYNSGSSTISGSLSNTPITGAGFALFVFRAGAGRIQLLFMAGASSSSTMKWIYLRVYISNAWTDWYSISGSRENT